MVTQMKDLTSPVFVGAVRIHSRIGCSHCGHPEVSRQTMIGTDCFLCCVRK